MKLEIEIPDENYAAMAKLFNQLSIPTEQIPAYFSLCCSSESHFDDLFNVTGFYDYPNRNEAVRAARTAMKAVGRPAIELSYRRGAVHFTETFFNPALIDEERAKKFHSLSLKPKATPVAA